MENKVSNVLKSLGFSKNEVVVYLDLLKHSSSTAFEIAKHTKLHRSNVYENLRFLENKGLVNKTISEDTTIFRAMEPKAIHDYLKAKENEVKDIIPELENIQKTSFEDEIAVISYGLPGLRNCFQKMMSDLNEIQIFNSPTNILNILGNEFLHDFHKWRIDNKIPMKVIYAHECERGIIAKKFPYLDIKYFPGNQESLCPFVVCKNNVFFILLTNPPTIIEINSNKIAETFKKNFEFVWNRLDEPS